MELPASPVRQLRILGEGSEEMTRLGRRRRHRVPGQASPSSPSSSGGDSNDILHNDILSEIDSGIIFRPSQVHHTANGGGEVRVGRTARDIQVIRDNLR